MMLAGPGGFLGELCKLNVNCTKKRGMLYVGIETITMRKRYQFTFAVKPLTGAMQRTCHVDSQIIGLNHQNRGKAQRFRGVCPTEAAMGLFSGDKWKRFAKERGIARKSFSSAPNLLNLRRYMCV